MRRSLAILTCWALVLSLGGCTPATSPTGAAGPTGNVNLGGDYDAEAGTFLLRVLEDPGQLLHVELIGEELLIDPVAETVTLQVRIRNLAAALHPPLTVWIRSFTPPGVTPLNADYVIPGPDDVDLLPLEFGFDYSNLLGDDGVLTTGELSGARSWIFHDPGLASFSFGARLEAGLEPDLPRIAGRCFMDWNRNGIPEPGEPPFAGEVELRKPSGEATVAIVGPEGHYAFHTLETGLHRLRCMPQLPPGPPWIFTTPNPLELLLTPGPDGLPLGFHDAHFGVFRDDLEIPPVRFTDLPPDSLHYAHWQLLGLGIEADRMDFHLGYSGCQPDHPFSLWISGGFMESWPVQVNAVLVHELDEECDAWFEGERHFDLMPLKEAYLEAYGEPAVLIVNLIDFQGAVHPVEYLIEDSDSLP